MAKRPQRAYLMSRILNTCCCIALLLAKNDEIFSLEFFRYCDHMDISILQTSFLPSFYCIAIKVFLMTLLEIYYD